MRDAASTIMTLSRLSKRRNRRIKTALILIGIILAAVAVILLYCFINKRTEILRNGSDEHYDLVVSAIDVGQACASAVRCGHEVMLIDSGLYESRDAVKAYLDDNKITKIKYAVATHPHGDHIGCMADIILNYEVENLILPRIESESACYVKMIEAAKGKGVKLIFPEVRDKFYVGNAEAMVLSVGDSKTEDVNDAAIVLKLSFDERRFLIMSDVSGFVEEAVMAKENVRAEVLFLSHHGSNDASTTAFLKKVRPTEAVISCGKNNEYGHPHSEVLKRLKACGIAWARTDEEGTISYGVKSGEGLYRIN